MEKEKIAIAQMDTLCKAGAIISIIGSGLIILGSLIWGILWLTLDFNITNTNLTPEQMDYLRMFRKISAAMIIIMGVIQILPLYFCINLLRGKASSNIPAGVLSLIFSGLIGGILILVGKYQVGTVTTTVETNDSAMQQNNA